MPGPRAADVPLETGDTLLSRGRDRHDSSSAQHPGGLPTGDGTGQVPVARDRQEDGAGHHLRIRVSEDILHQQLT